MELKQWLSGRQQLNRYIESKKNIIYGQKLPDDIGDKKAVIEASQKFVRLYEEKQRLMEAYEQSRDSLVFIYKSNSARIQRLKQVINGNLLNKEGTELITQKLKEENVLDRKTEKMLRALYAVRTLAVGRTLPHMTNLSVNNLNVNGLNFEYNPGKYYMAVTAGKIDFRSRDFLYGRPSKVPQYVLAASIGYGRRENDHLFLTGYTGKKQIISDQKSNAYPLSGISLQGQWVWQKYMRIVAEIAQSTSPVYTDAKGMGHRGFNISDQSNKAYSVQLYSYIPSTQTRLEGYYQKTGINFQNFTNYRVNANASTWSIRAEQYLFRKQLKLLAAAKKNDYSNPYVLQQYNANTIFTSFAATFCRRNWPALTVGYMPSSQYTLVGNQVAEMRYQTFNINMSHGYHIGAMTATGMLLYNKFYNRSSDASFLYYNADHFYTFHQFNFRLFTANIAYARTQNSMYELDVMEGGMVLHINKYLQAGYGIKINNYKTREVKTGGYGNLRVNWPSLGDFTLWYEHSYLPGANNMLLGNEWCTISFTRYFNNKLSIWPGSSH